MKVLDCPSVTVRGRMKVFHRGCDIGVAHQVFDGDNVNTFGSQSGTKGMPEIVYSEVRQTSLSPGYIHIKTL